MYEVLIFHNGPRSKWSGKVADDDVIARFRYPFLWLARWCASSMMGQLNQGRCGYAILKDGVVMDQYSPQPQPAG